MVDPGLDFDTAVKIGIPTAGLAVGWLQRRRIRAQLKKTNEWIDAKKKQDEMGKQMRKEVGDLITILAGGGVDFNKAFDLADRVGQDPTGDLTTSTGTATGTSSGNTKQLTEQSGTANGVALRDIQAKPLVAGEDYCLGCSKPIDKTWVECPNCHDILLKKCKCGADNPVSRIICVKCGNKFAQLHKFGPRGKGG